MPEERNFLFVLSPNAGILDSWLPVLDRLAKVAGVKIHALLPRPEATLYLRHDDFMVRSSRRIFTAVHFCSAEGRWAPARDLIHARRKLILGNRFRAVLRQTPAAHIESVGHESARLEKAARAYLARAGLLRSEAMFCDISEYRKPYFLGLLRATPQVRIHSVSQGIALREAVEGRPASVRPALPDYLSERIATQFLLDKSEETHYRTRFVLSARQISVSGVFRHDPEWLERMPAVKRRLAPGSYVFLASRPVNVRHFPLAEKQRTIRMVHKQAGKRGLTLAIRRHPFEGNRREIERLIGKPGKRNHWLETRRHPLDVGARCAFAVTLNSSVAVDMAAMGVPVIEPIDYTGYPQDVPNIRFNQNGRKISTYSKAGITTEASSENDFAASMDRLLTQGSSSVRRASEAYRALYPDPAGAIDIAVQRVLEQSSA